MEQINFLQLGPTAHCLKCHADFSTEFGTDTRLKHSLACNLPVVHCEAISGKTCGFKDREFVENLKFVLPDLTEHTWKLLLALIQGRVIDKIEQHKEIVICAAIRMKDGYVIRGHRHCDAILTASKIPRYKEASHAFGNNQGFVTSKNRYVDRLEGARLQKEAGIKSKMPEGLEYLHGELYSEDLY